MAVGVLGVLLFAMFSALLVWLKGKEWLGSRLKQNKEWDIWSTQGPYAPFRVLAKYKDAALPEGCQITQVNIVS